MSRTAGGPLQGIRVIELTHAIAGPHCAQMLADHGADVIKVEPPEGELARMAYPVSDGESVYFASHNRGKRSVRLDLKSPAGQGALRQLCASADIVVTNYGDGVPDRLGFSYETIRELNPGVVYAHITGFGLGAEWAPGRAFDGVIQAMSGAADLTGSPDGDPTLVGVFVVDHIAANHAVISILMALQGRHSTGRGALLPISMLDSYQSMFGHEVGMAHLGNPGVRHGNLIPGAFGDVFRTSDGAAFLSPVAQPAWERFWDCLGQPEIAQEICYDDSVGPEYDRLHAIVTAWVAERTTEQVTKLLSDAGIPNGPVATITDAVEGMASPARQRLVDIEAPQGHRFAVAISPIPLERAEDERSRRVPGLGQHTREVLAPLLSEDQFAAALAIDAD